MKTFSRRLIASALLLGVAGAPLLADDIDLYTGGEQVTGVTPNVLIVLDNSSNWAAASQHWPDGGKQGVSELQSLSEVVNLLKGRDISVGLMVFGRDGGGLVRYSVRDMSLANNGDALKQILDYMAINAVGSSDADEVSSNTNYDDMMNSAFRYFNGKTTWKDGNDSFQDRRDYNGNTNNTAAQPSFSPYALGQYSLSSSASTTYNPPPQAADGCAKNFIIFIGNGFPQNVGTAADLTAAGALVDATPDTNQIVSISPKNPYADEWAKFMYQYGVKTDIDNPRDPTKKLFNKVITYTIDVCKDACEPAQETLLRSMATVGGGSYFKSTSKSEIKTALERIFAEIQAVNSVFASASLPVSVNTQGTFENQVYIGMFRPDGNARPRWYGNLKEYKFARYCDANDDGKVQTDEMIDDTVTDTSFCTPTSRIKLYLGDRFNKPAIDQTTGSGFIDVNATSYWTTAQSPGFWTFFPDPVAGTDDSPDGPLVERGGAAYRLRNTFATGRKVFTCMGSCLGSSDTDLTAASQAFDTANTTVVSRLTPAGAKTVTLARSGATVTATSTGGALGFNNGDAIVISGANPGDYDGAYTITSVGPAATSFTYGITERPTDDASLLAVMGAGSTANITSLVINEATATVTATAAGHGLSDGQTVTISNASQSFLNGSKIVSASTADTFSYAVTLPNPTSPATTPGTSKGPSGVTLTNSSVTLVGTSPRVVVVRTGSNHGYSAGFSVTVAGAVPADYNGIWTLSGVGTACSGVANSEKNKAYCFNLIKSPDGGLATYTKISSPVPVKITRTIGSATATAQGFSDSSATATAVNHGLANGSTVTIAGSTQNQYNGSWTISTIAGDPTKFSFGPVTLSPAAPSGTATASYGSNIAASNLISWVRGRDVFEDENQNGSLTDVRASIHADVLHSRPLMLNYGSTGGVVGFYGTNDGFLHAIQGGTADSDGYEKWSFIPDEFVSYTKLARLYLNQPLIRYPNLACGITPTPQSRDYFWDGAITGYQNSDRTVSWIFASMRRGGSSVYALDVSDPDAPLFKWRASPALADFADLQQTWSEPKVVQFRGKSSGVEATKLAVVFGSGYAASQEDKPAGSARTALGGSGVYVVDADTGGRIAYLEPPADVHKYSFAADVTPYDMDGDGYVDRIYAVDTGGNLFRFDVDTESTPGATWTSYLIAKLGDVDSDGGTDARKFLFAPAVTPFLDTDGKTALNVMVGSGDREKPLANPVTATCPSYYGGSASFGSAVQDKFYAVMDRVLPGAAAATVNASPIVEGNLLEVNANPDALTRFELSSSYKGWYITLKNDTDVPANSADNDEEKVVNSAILVGGVLYFATNTPQRPDTSRGICSNLGEALAYAVDPMTGLPAFNRDGVSGFTNAKNYSSVLDGGGLTPAVTSGVVMIGGKPYYGIIGGGGEGETGRSGIEGGKVTQNIPGNRKRVYWYYRGVDN